jgi:hypothetical protein
VLSQYVKEDSNELPREKLPPLLRLKYHAISDAVADLGRPEEIGPMFSGFQNFLYERRQADGYSFTKDSPRAPARDRSTTSGCAAGIR